MSSEGGCVRGNENWFSFLKGLWIHSSVSMVRVCSLRWIWERPLEGPFHFCKSPTPPRILHRSSLTVHITSSLSLWQCHLLGHILLVYHWIYFIFIDAAQQLACYVLFWFTPCLYHWNYLVILGAAQLLASFVFKFCIWFTTCPFLVL